MYCGIQFINKKRKFDPTDECIVAGQHRRKKSASQLKGRSKQITVVLLSNIPSSIPKGTAREQLKKKGKVREVPFQRYMSEEEVKEVLVENFECLSDSEVQFLQSHKNNSLLIAKVQDLDGIGVISLAGCGSLYLKVSPKEGSENRLASTSIGDITELSPLNSHSGPLTLPSHTNISAVQTLAGSSTAGFDTANSTSTSDTVKETLKKVDEFLNMIFVSCTLVGIIL